MKLGCKTKGGFTSSVFFTCGAEVLMVRQVLSNSVSHYYITSFQIVLKKILPHYLSIKFQLDGLTFKSLFISKTEQLGDEKSKQKYRKRQLVLVSQIFKSHFVQLMFHRIHFCQQRLRKYNFDSTPCFVEIVVRRNLLFFHFFSYDYSSYNNKLNIKSNYSLTFQFVNVKAFQIMCKHYVQASNSYPNYHILLYRTQNTSHCSFSVLYLI
eukprot:TRINITY_DN24678_c1_g1_i1.p1 TRINITY_DN24678_c1_g1~~TRINITY_DN24678_c1_g1_i1.p1  ORF type:complete len:210 (-),score=-19.98 TRINITY_DN24678_c1_g1_i1:32-661(-)